MGNEDRGAAATSGEIVAAATPDAPDVRSMAWDNGAMKVPFPWGETATPRDMVLAARDGRLPVGIVELPPGVKPTEEAVRCAVDAVYDKGPRAVLRTWGFPV